VDTAPKKRDVLGTTFLSVLAGHWRYAHMTTVRRPWLIRGDNLDGIRHQYIRRGNPPGGHKQQTVAGRR